MDSKLGLTNRLISYSKSLLIRESDNEKALAILKEERLLQRYSYGDLARLKEILENELDRLNVLTNARRIVWVKKSKNIDGKLVLYLNANEDICSYIEWSTEL